MCDTSNQLPYAAPAFYQKSGLVFLTPAARVIYAGVVEGVVDYPQAPIPLSFMAPPQPFRLHPETLEALTRLHNLSDELARLTLNMPADEQAGVWAAYYALHRALTGAPEEGR